MHGLWLHKILSEAAAWNTVSSVYLCNSRPSMASRQESSYRSNLSLARPSSGRVAPEVDWADLFRQNPLQFRSPPTSSDSRSSTYPSTSPPSSPTSSSLQATKPYLSIWFQVRESICRLPHGKKILGDWALRDDCPESGKQRVSHIIIVDTDCD